MGVFGKIFKNNKETTTEKTIKIPWNNLIEIGDLEKIEQESETKLVVIFKHSTRCGTSRMVLKTFEKEFHHSPDQVKLYFLDILNHREVSQEIASRFEVMHESPQLLAIRERKVAYHASHAEIDVQDLEKFLPV